MATEQEGRYGYYTLADLRAEGLLRGTEGNLSGLEESVHACTRYEATR